MMVDLDNPAAAIIELVVMFVVVSALIGAFAGFGTSADGSVYLGADGERLFENTNVTQVENTTGRAATLSADADVQISGGIGVDGDVWSWSTYAKLDDTTRDQVIWSVRQNWVLAYNGTNSNWVLWYYNSTSTNSYRTSVDASPSGLTNVQVERDNSTVTLYNATDANSSFTITPTTDSSATVPAYGSLDGTLEETRTWGRTLSSSERQALRDTPVEPLPGDRRARLMFDAGGRSVAVDLRSASGSIEGSYPLLENPRGPGFAAAVLTEGTDYNVTETEDGDRLTMTGNYEKMPRVVISSPDTTVEGLLGSLTGLLDLIALVVMGALIIKLIQG